MRASRVDGPRYSPIPRRSSTHIPLLQKLFTVCLVSDGGRDSDSRSLSSDRLRASRSFGNEACS